MVHLLLVIIYLSFISLGLPDSLLGSAWPSMHLELAVPISYAGPVSMIIAAGTIVSSLQSDRLTRKLGTARVTAVSVAMTAAALLGFSISHSYWQLLIWAVPYGLGAGSIDAALNNYVALHYASRHMSWLHCFWGIGAMTGPIIMGAAITGGLGWNGGYRIVGLLQIVLTVILVISLPLWKGRTEDVPADAADAGPLSLSEIVRIPGAKAVMLCFFCYCALEAAAGLWASTFLMLRWNISPVRAASLASLFYIGITTGRAVSGFATFKFNDQQMVYIGQGIILTGVLMLGIPFGPEVAMIGFIAIGLGCAPVYPSLIHATPAHFGADKSQAIIGVQMASAYTGTCLMPPLFGVIANAISIRLLPVFLLVLLILMTVSHFRLNDQTMR